MVENNLEFCRELCRVIERSEVIIQIVDSRHPMIFRCPDLEVYVKEVSPLKKNLLLINKADLLTFEQRESWSEYLIEQGIDFAFFSALEEDAGKSDGGSPSDSEEESGNSEDEADQNEKDAGKTEDEKSESGTEPAAK